MENDCIVEINKLNSKITLHSLLNDHPEWKVARILLHPSDCRKKEIGTNSFKYWWERVKKDCSKSNKIRSRKTPFLCFLVKIITWSRKQRLIISTKELVMN